MRCTGCVRTERAVKARLHSTRRPAILSNKLKNENYSVYPLIHGLSVHDAQVLSLLNILLPDD